MKKSIVIGIIVATFCIGSCKKDDAGNTTINGDVGTVVDIDNNTYNIVKIYDQWWMAENLKTTHYANGEAIPLVESESDWSLLESTDKAYCYYENSDSIASIYGALYTWAAAMNGEEGSDNEPSGVQGICPDGWHLPSDKEWRSLESYVGGDREAAIRLKETGVEHWLSNNDATNETGFTALPGGMRSYGGIFGGIGWNGYWWTSTSSIAAPRYWTITLHDDIESYSSSHQSGYCIRCVMD